MKKRIIVATTISALFLSYPICAEIVDYNDDYVSFSYDNDMSGTLYSHLSENSVGYLLICADKTSDGHAQCAISIHKKHDEFDQDLYEKMLKDSPSDYVIIQDDDVFSYISWLSDSDDEDINSWVDLFRESISISDDIDDIEASEEIEYSDIFSNYHYSDQVYAYAQKALDILNGYMDMTLQKEDAVKQIGDLYSRVESYVENSEYYFDGDLKNALYFTDKYIESGDDGEIVKAINELQRILDKQ